MTPFERLAGLNSIFSVCCFNNYLRVTFVSHGWLIVWDHRNRPPIRYDCKTLDHHEACELAAIMLQELTKS